MLRKHALLVGLLVAVSGCAQDFDLELDIVRTAAPSDVTVTIDGQEISGEKYTTSYASFGDAKTASTLLVEVAKGGGVQDSKAVRPDACWLVCEAEFPSSCDLGDLKSSMLLLSVGPDYKLSSLQGTCTDGETVFNFTP